MMFHRTRFKNTNLEKHVCNDRVERVNNKQTLGVPLTAHMLKNKTILNQIHEKYSNQIFPLHTDEKS